jgi:hypothetical protein
MKRVAFDQLIFAPFGVACFFTAMTVAEGGGKTAVLHKLRDMYVPTLKANYVLWPAVQIVNFRLMPVQFQLVSAAPTPFRRDSLLTELCLPCSLSYRRSELHGLRTSHLPMLPRMSKRAVSPTGPMLGCRKCWDVRAYPDSRHKTNIRTESCNGRELKEWVGV